MPIVYPNIAGLAPDWSSVELDVAGVGIFTGVKELTWTQTLEPGIVRGTRAEKLARTRGEYEAEGSMVMYLADYHELIAGLSAAGTGYMESVFNITALYDMGDGTLNTTRLIGCRIKSEEGGGSQGTDPLEVSLDLDIMRIENQRPAGDIAFPITNQLT